MNRSFILRTILLSSFMLVGIQGAAGQDTVSLYLKADPSSYLVDNLPSDDPRLDSAVQLPANADQANIWKWVELRQTYQGYVRKTYVTKGLTIQAGSPVYFEPGNEDAFLTIVEGGSNAEVIETTGDDWVKVAIEASIPVYFESDTPAELPEVAETPDVANDEPVEVGSAVAVDEPIVDNPRDPNTTTYSRGEPIDRVLEGTLVLYKPAFYNPWNKPKYKWQILNRAKKRMAFVDTRNLIVDRPIELYENQRVSISGSIYQINNGKDLVIVANQLTTQ